MERAVCLAAKALSLSFFGVFSFSGMPFFFNLCLFHYLAQTPLFPLLLPSLSVPFFLLPPRAVKPVHKDK